MFSSKEKLLRKQRDKKFAEFESMFKGDSDLIASSQSDWLAGRARQHMMSGDQLSALSDYDDAILQDPKNVRTVVSYSATLRQLGEPKKAKRIFHIVDDKKILMDDPISLFRYYLEWAIVLIECDEDPEALKRLQRAVKVAEQKTHINKYLKEAREAKNAGLDINLESFDISGDLEITHKLIAEIKKNKSQESSNTQKLPKHGPKKDKSLSTEDVSALFTDIFLDNIDELRNSILQEISKKSKLAISEGEANAALFFSLLMYGTVPLFNLFDENIARKIFNQICKNVALAYDSDADELTNVVNSLRDNYNETIVENLRRMRGSAWLLDLLIKDASIPLYLHFDAMLLDASIFDWKKLSQDYTIYFSDQN